MTPYARGIIVGMFGLPIGYLMFDSLYMAVAIAIAAGTTAALVFGPAKATTR